jgi:putative aldouronate transport system substrate-binding protein
MHAHHSPASEAAAAARVSRRAFLRGAASVALIPAATALLSACAPAAPGSATPSTAQPVRLALPSYVPFAGPKPDFAGTADGVAPAYKTFPTQLTTSVATPPGKGGDVTIVDIISGPPGTALDQNAAWQQWNKLLNVNLQFSPASPQDYVSKFSTTVAGNDLPDVMSVPIQLFLPSNLPQLLDTRFADVTPFLAGDAIKQFPNLANLPPSGWPNVVYNGKLYGLPLVRSGVFNVAMFVQQNRLDDVGATPPKNADDLLRVLKALTRPQANQWGIGFQQNFNFNMPYFAQMFGAPNNWRASAGKLTKDIETDEYKAALGYVRGLVEAGVVYPDSMTTSLSAAKAQFLNGTFACFPDGFTAYQSYWDQGRQANANFKVRTLLPIGHDGGKPSYFFGPGALGFAIFKKAPDDRIRELLGVFNALDAPFGTAENLLFHYGVKDVDFAFDSAGNPVVNDRGRAELSVPWRNIADMPDAIFDPNAPDFAETVHADETAMVAVGVKDPSIGLYSTTYATKNGTLNQMVLDAANDVIFGRSSIDGWGQTVSNWRSQGGDQMRTEFEQALAAAG